MVKATFPNEKCVTLFNKLYERIKAEVMYNEQISVRILRQNN